jgi:hypothetical protein
MIKKLLAIVVLVMALSVAGCIQTQNASSGSLQVNAYANAFVNSTKANLGPGETLVSFNVVQNGSDAMQVTMTVTNTTPTSIWSNGSQYTYALNIKQFDTTNDASNFYNGTSFGYNQGNSASMSLSTTNVYEQVMGHAPTMNRYSTQETSLSLLGGTINVAIQQDEFVTYGAVTVVPGASTTASTSASASASVTPSNTPSVTPSADVYQVVVSGPTDGQYGAVWTATIYKNGVVVPCDQLTGQVLWYINGQPSNGGTFGGSQCTMTHDANGLAGSPFQHTNVITASYNGVTSLPAYYTDNEISTPTPIVTAVPTPTPTPTPSPTPTPTPRVIRIV